MKFRLPAWLISRIFASVWNCADRHADVVIGETSRPYLKRWHIIRRNRFFNIYLHEFFQSDNDLALHDHPWINISILLRGEYFEHLRNGLIDHREAGDIVFRLPAWAHRIELPSECGDLVYGQVNTVWTLFVTGPKVREWGFLCPKGWVHWKDFTSDDGRGIGRGCEESDE